MTFFLKNKKAKLNRGMTYVEIIVVLSIFSVMSSIVIFNYGKFQAKVDIKNLANDIALKVVEAQKSALGGKFAPKALFDAEAKPSYGVYFDYGTDARSFIYFADLNNDNLCGNDDDGHDCPNSVERINKILIKKGNNYISSIDSYVGTSIHTNIPDQLSITFRRPDSTARFHSDSLDLVAGAPDYIKIQISAPDNSASSSILIYRSGRIQINQ